MAILSSDPALSSRLFTNKICDLELLPNAHQIEVAPESRELLTLSTDWGLFQPTRSVISVLTGDLAIRLVLIKICLFFRSVLLNQFDQ